MASLIEYVVENQRWRPIAGWSFKLLRSDPPAWSSTEGNVEKFKHKIELPEGYVWKGDWTPRCSIQTDKDGWIYAHAFHDFERNNVRYHSQHQDEAQGHQHAIFKRGRDFVRQRIWQRVATFNLASQAFSDIIKQKKDGFKLSGFMTKKGRVIPSWKVRWFVLSDRKLLYFSTSSSSSFSSSSRTSATSDTDAPDNLQLKGSLDCRFAVAEHYPSSFRSPKYCMQVTIRPDAAKRSSSLTDQSSPTRVLYLGSDHENECKQWLEGINYVSECTDISDTINLDSILQDIKLNQGGLINASASLLASFASSHRDTETDMKSLTIDWFPRGLLPISLFDYITLDPLETALSSSSKQHSHKDSFDVRDESDTSSNPPKYRWPFLPRQEWTVAALEQVILASGFYHDLSTEPMFPSPPPIMRTCYLQVGPILDLHNLRYRMRKGNELSDSSSSSNSSSVTSSSSGTAFDSDLHLYAKISLNDTEDQVIGTEHSQSSFMLQLGNHSNLSPQIPRHLFELECPIPGSSVSSSSSKGQIHHYQLGYQFAIFDTARDYVIIEVKEHHTFSKNISLCLLRLPLAPLAFHQSRDQEGAVHYTVCINLHTLKARCTPIKGAQMGIYKSYFARVPFRNRDTFKTLKKTIENQRKKKKKFSSGSNSSPSNGHEAGNSDDCKYIEEYSSLFPQRIKKLFSQTSTDATEADDSVIVPLQNSSSKIEGFIFTTISMIPPPPSNDKGSLSDLTTAGSLGSSPLLKSIVPEKKSVAVSRQYVDDDIHDTPADGNKRKKTVHDLTSLLEFVNYQLPTDILKLPVPDYQALTGALHAGMQRLSINQCNSSRFHASLTFRLWMLRGLNPKVLSYTEYERWVKRQVAFLLCGGLWHIHSIDARMASLGVPAQYSLRLPKELSSGKTETNLMTLRSKEMTQRLVTTAKDCCIALIENYAYVPSSESSSFPSRLLSRNSVSAPQEYTDCDLDDLIMNATPTVTRQRQQSHLMQYTKHSKQHNMASSDPDMLLPFAQQAQRRQSYSDKKRKKNSIHNSGLVARTHSDTFGFGYQRLSMSTSAHPRQLDSDGIAIETHSDPDSEIPTVDDVVCSQALDSLLHLSQLLREIATVHVFLHGLDSPPNKEDRSGPALCDIGCCESDVKSDQGTFNTPVCVPVQLASRLFETIVSLLVDDPNQGFEENEHGKTKEANSDSKVDRTTSNQPRSLVAVFEDNPETGESGIENDDNTEDVSQHVKKQRRKKRKRVKLHSSDAKLRILLQYLIKAWNLSPRILNMFVMRAYIDIIVSQQGDSEGLGSSATLFSKIMSLSSQIPRFCIDGETENDADTENANDRRISESVSTRLDFTGMQMMDNYLDDSVSHSLTSLSQESGYTGDNAVANTHEKGQSNPIPCDPVLPAPASSVPSSSTLDTIDEKSLAKDDFEDKTEFHAREDIQYLIQIWSYIHGHFKRWLSDFLGYEPEVISQALSSFVSLLFLQHSPSEVDAQLAQVVLSSTYTHFSYLKQDLLTQEPKPNTSNNHSSAPSSFNASSPLGLLADESPDLDDLNTEQVDLSVFLLEEKDKNGESGKNEEKEQDLDDEMIDMIPERWQTMVTDLEETLMDNMQLYFYLKQRANHASEDVKGQTSVKKRVRTEETVIMCCPLVVLSLASCFAQLVKGFVSMRTETLATCAEFPQEFLSCIALIKRAQMLFQAQMTMIQHLVQLRHCKSSEPKDQKQPKSEQYLEEAQDLLNSHLPDLTAIFSSILSRWLGRQATKSLKLCQSLIASHDTWKALDQTKGMNYSASIVDLFSFLHDLKRYFFHYLEVMDPYTPALFPSFIRFAAGYVVTYCTLLLRSCGNLHHYAQYPSRYFAIISSTTAKTLAPSMPSSCLTTPRPSDMVASVTPMQVGSGHMVYRRSTVFLSPLSPVTQPSAFSSLSTSSKNEIKKLQVNLDAILQNICPLDELCIRLGTVHEALRLSAEFIKSVSEHKNNKMKSRKKPGLHSNSSTSSCSGDANIKEDTEMMKILNESFKAPITEQSRLVAVFIAYRTVYVELYQQIFQHLYSQFTPDFLERQRQEYKLLTALKKQLKKKGDHGIDSSIISTLSTYDECKQVFAVRIAGNSDFDTLMDELMTELYQLMPDDNVFGNICSQILEQALSLYKALLPIHSSSSSSSSSSTSSPTTSSSMVLKSQLQIYQQLTSRQCLRIHLIFAQDLQALVNTFADEVHPDRLSEFVQAANDILSTLAVVAAKRADLEEEAIFRNAELEPIQIPSISSPKEHE